MNTTWILVSNASRARLFSVPRKGQAWTLVRELEHPESRLKGQDIMSDAPGRVQQSFGAGSRPAMEPTTPPKEVEAERFALELANVLDDGHGQNAYARLVLVAPPQFLGLLRKSIGNQVAKRVTASLDKDLTEVKDIDLPERIADVL